MKRERGAALPVGALLLPAGSRAAGDARAVFGKKVGASDGTLAPTW